MEPSAESAVEAIRRFNRFYTRQAGVLQEHLVHSQYGLTEARVLYELAHQAPTTATQLIRDLSLNAGYLSRILARFGRRGLVKKEPAETDGRQSVLRLTPKGERAFAELNLASRKEVGRMLGPLGDEDRRRLVAAMGTIESVLGASPERGAPYILRPPRPGDMGWVVQRHGELYATEYGWNEEFEALVAEIVAKFVRGFDPKRERCWIVEQGGERLGCVFCCRRSAAVAQLRLLLVEPRARGLGLGGRLVTECVQFARLNGYRAMMLWTNDVLHAARAIYEREGFQLVKQGPHHSFGADLVEQTWELKL